MKLLRNSSWLVCLALVTACGDDGPQSPIAPSPTNITVTGSDLLLVGNSATFVAAGNRGVLTAPRWGSDAPTVATVNADTGQVTVGGIGTATIFVDANGLRGTKLIRTLPNFGGEWSGRYNLIDCINSRADRTACSWKTKDPYPLSMSFTQNRDSVSGSFNFEGSHRISGTVSPNGVLSVVTAGGLYTLFGYVQNIRFESTEAGQLTGTFEEVWPSLNDGEVRFVFQLLGVSRK